MTILCCGGGTMGPVTPLLAVIRQMRKTHPNLTVAWAGTDAGPERSVVEAEGIRFFEIPTVKIPRYISWSWLTWPCAYAAARKQSRHVLDEVRPTLIVSVGGFTAVPMMREGAHRGIPCAIHQLDFVVGLANRAVASSCRLVTTSFSYATLPFRVSSTRVATPCRFANNAVPLRELAIQSFGLDPKRPVIFAVGGGTGALAINRAIQEILDTELRTVQLIHLTGIGKMRSASGQVISPKLGYVVAEFFDEQQMLQAYAAADLVISRAGMGSISDLASLSKPTILIPIPHSHQEENAKQFAVPIVHQTDQFSKKIQTTITAVMKDDRERIAIGKRMHEALETDDGNALAERWLGLFKTT